MYVLGYPKYLCNSVFGAHSANYVCTFKYHMYMYLKLPGLFPVNISLLEGEWSSL